MVHYQFTSWPDHGVPDVPTAALDFVRVVHELIQPAHGPVIVHCRYRTYYECSIYCLI